VDVTKHTQSAAADLSNLHRSQFSRLLQNHQGVATANLEKLSKWAVRQLLRVPVVKGAPWTVAILIDSTLHGRSSRHVHNVQKFNHGEGWVIGHQWTNIVMVIGNELIPLSPIPFWSKKECRKRGMPYQTEHERICKYLKALDLREYVGFFSPSEVVVMSDSGYDNKKLQSLILSLGWDFLGALKSTRSMKLPTEIGMSKTKWRQVNILFRAVKKQAPWQSVRIEAAEGKKRRKFRARLITAQLKGVNRLVAVVCSEKQNGKGKRRYFACSNKDLTAATILKAYRIRWTIEIFHRTTKSYLGLEHAGVTNFDSLVSHVHWVYVAYILLREFTDSSLSVPQKQIHVRELFRTHELRNLRQLATRINGKQEVKSHCDRALNELDAA
jgi:hypothetical protein